MKTILSLADLLDLARERNGIPSDGKLAVAMSVEPQQISQWRHNSHVPKGEHVAPLAALTGLTEQFVMLCFVHAERKRSEKEREVIRQIAATVKRTAAIVTLGIAGILGLSHAPIARAATEDSATTIYYGKYHEWEIWGRAACRIPPRYSAPAGESTNSKPAIRGHRTTCGSFVTANSRSHSSHSRTDSRAL